MLGRWTGFLTALGVPGHLLTGKQGSCPMCVGKTKFRFDNLQGRGTWICNDCGAGDGAELAMRVTGLRFRELAELVEPMLGTITAMPVAPARPEGDLYAYLRKLWRSVGSVEEGDPAALRWLRYRRVYTDPAPRCLRAISCLAYSHEVSTPSFHPAMLAQVLDHAGNPVAIHRTYLTAEGKKADVPKARLSLGPLPDGSAVRLSRAGPTLGIAEGIETALAASRIFEIPVWAALNAGRLAAWSPPPNVEHVVILGDNDKSFTGQFAAFTLAHRLARPKTGLRVAVEIPPTTGTDWADVLVKRFDTSTAAA
ncbi:DUF7146 domain-containing protein [Methylobacterium sp. CM6247]